MLSEIIFPTDWNISIDSIDIEATQVVLCVYRTESVSSCPDCQTPSQRVHGHYRRHPWDLPIGDNRVKLELTVRRFCCDNPKCRRTTFAEPMDKFLTSYARRTNRLKTQHQLIGFELAAENGSRILEKQKMSISGDTLLRSVHSAAEPQIQTPRVVGVDDWAKRKGHSYGTIVVDLEARQVVDLLPDRTAESLATWLREHPGVEIISRDRSGEYAKGATDGAPDAIQVADRWHLLENLRKHLQDLLCEKPDCLEAAAMKELEQNPASVDNSPSEHKPPWDETVETPQHVPQESAQTTGNSDSRVDSTLATGLPLEEASTHKAEPQPQQTPLLAHNRRERRYQAVKTLHSQGKSKSEIARQLKIDPKTIRKYISADSCPTYSPRRPRPSKLDSYKDVIKKRWEAGDNATQIFSHLRQLGYKGGRSIVMDYIKNTLRGSGHRANLSWGPTPATEAAVESMATVEPIPVIPWSSRQASWLLAKPAENLSSEEMGVLDRMQQASADVRVAYTLAQQFGQMVRQLRPEPLLPWIETVKESGLSALSRFANGIERDLSAVIHALSLPWSQGQTEGQVNRLKLIKRTMYGRASFDLLRKRVLGAPMLC